MAEGQSGEFEPVYLTSADVLEPLSETAKDRNLRSQSHCSRRPLGRPVISDRKTTADP